MCTLRVWRSTYTIFFSENAVKCLKASYKFKVQCVQASKLDFSWYYVKCAKSDVENLLFCFYALLSNLRLIFYRD